MQEHDVSGKFSNFKSKFNRETINGLASAIKRRFLKSGVFKAF